MKTFSINTLGCKVNQYETQQIQQLLEQLGLRKSEPPKKSDLVVINTCCVTHTASAKSRQYIRKAQKLNPDAVVVVCGTLHPRARAQLRLFSRTHGIEPVLMDVNDRSNLAAIKAAAEKVTSRLMDQIESHGLCFLASPESLVCDRSDEGKEDRIDCTLMFSKSQSLFSRITPLLSI